MTGTLLALFVIGEPGAMDARESLFLNAFLVVEAFKAVMRVLFASSLIDLRQQLVNEVQPAVGQPLAELDIVLMAPGDDLLHYLAAPLLHLGLRAQRSRRFAQQGAGAG